MVGATMHDAVAHGGEAAGSEMSLGKMQQRIEGGGKGMGLPGGPFLLSEQFAHFIACHEMRCRFQILYLAPRRWLQPHIVIEQGEFQTG